MDEGVQTQTAGVPYACPTDNYTENKNKKNGHT